MPPNAATSIASDSAAETLFGHGVHYEPTGPNTPLAKDAQGNELYPGPGDNAFLDRPSSCVAQTVPSLPAGTCILGGGSNPPGARTDAGATAPAASSTIADNAIVATDAGRTVTGAGIPPGAFVGHVTDTPTTATAPSQSGGFVDTGSFTLVDSSGNPLSTTAAVSGIVLGARSAATDPLLSATGATDGGGDTGSVLISSYIKPGTVSTVDYNHYSWLRTMEDLFNVGRDSRGLDGAGHIGYAAQPGLAPFGRDVFNFPQGHRDHNATDAATGSIDRVRQREPAHARAIERAQMTTADRRASRAFRPGARRTVAFALAGLAIAVAVSVGASRSGSTGSPPKSSPSKARPHATASNSSPPRRRRRGRRRRTHRR